MVERDYCVYMHVFNNDNKYIGITNNPDKRFRDGFNPESIWGKYNDYVLNTFFKHGLKETIYLHENVKLETAKILEIIQISMNNTLNIKYGGSNHNGLNLDKGGGHAPILKGENHPNTNLTQSKVDKIKIDLGNGRPQPEIAKENGLSTGIISNINNGITWIDSNINYPIYSNYKSDSLKGKTRSEESKKKQSENMKDRFIGENHPMWGRKQSDESKMKMSESTRGENHPKFKYSDDLKRKSIILALLDFKHQFIADIYDIENLGSISQWKNGRRIGGIDLDDLKQISIFLENNPCYKGFLLRC